MHQTTITDKNENELHLAEIIENILKYKWSIILITALIFLLVLIRLYFQPSVYLSSALIEVKSNPQSSLIGEGTGAITVTKEKIDKEIEILRTFYMNDKVLNKLNFGTRYFIDSGYKKVEIYKDIPIKINNIAIFDKKILGKKIKITPALNGFYLSITKSFLDKLSKYNPLHNQTDAIVFDEKKIYHYNKNIESDYFTFTIKKLHKFDKPLYFSILGDNKHIFDSIQNNLSISQVTDSAPLIRVRFEDNVLERADKYVNTLIDTFIQKSIEDKEKQAEKVINYINKELNKTKNVLDGYESKLETYKIQNNAIQPSLQGQTYIAELNKIKNELSEYRLKKNLISDVLKAVKRDHNLNGMATSLIKLENISTISLIEKLQEVQIKEEELRARYSYKHPSLRPIRKKIYHIQQNIIKNIKSLDARTDQKIKSLNKLKLSYKSKLASLPTKERKLVGLKRDYEVSTTIYNTLLNTKSKRQVEKVAIQSNYRVIDYAKNTEAIPIKPKRLFSLIIAILLGLFIGIVQALLRNKLDNKISSKNVLLSLTNLPLYGILPNFKKRNMKIEVLADLKSPYAEAHRSLRTNLQFTQNKGKAHTILITSTIMGEGKSTTVVNLSAIFSLAEYKCLVINLDLRKPTLHKYFNVNNSTGISTYLSGKNHIHDIITPTKYDNIDIITSGPIPPNPSELIMTDKMDILMDDLKEKYDYIFIDSAPLGLVTDTMHLMQYANINLIIFREDYALKSFATDLNSLVERHNLKHIGLVLNASDMSSGSYGYGYGY